MPGKVGTGSVGGGVDGGGDGGTLAMGALREVEEGAELREVAASVIIGDERTVAAEAICGG
jgi:hypothetical protein